MRERFVNIYNNMNWMVPTPRIPGTTRIVTLGDPYEPSLSTGQMGEGTIHNV